MTDILSHESTDGLVGEVPSVPAAPVKAAARTKKRGRPALNPAGSLLVVSTTVDASIKEAIRQRAAAEERTEAVIVRRALKFYMDGWDPTEG